MDLDTVRTFVAVADAGQFQQAAAELTVTQQAVSKRVAALERTLGVRLFTRTPRGAGLTIDGQAFLPHARELLRVAERAVASVRTGRRPLRVDVIASRVAPSGLLRGFHRAYPDIELDVVMLFDVETAVAAIRSGEIDASFRAVGVPGRPLPEDIESVRVLDEPLQLLTGPAHALAGARSVPLAQLAGHRIWMPGIVPGPSGPPTTTTWSPSSASPSRRPAPTSAPTPSSTPSPTPRPWPPSWASTPGWSGPPATACAASR